MAFPQCRGEGESEEGKVVSFLFGTVVDESSRLVALLSRRRRGSASLLVFCVSGLLSVLYLQLDTIARVCPLYKVPPALCNFAARE